MDRDAFARSVRHFVRRRRFRPFTIELLSGDRFVIHHPEAIALTSAGYVVVGPDNSIRRFDSSSVSQILSEVVPPR